jgi:hypothetical protein
MFLKYIKIFLKNYFYHQQVKIFKNIKNIKQKNFNFLLSSI